MGRWMCSELRRLLPSLNEYELLPENVTKTVHVIDIGLSDHRLLLWSSQLRRPVPIYTDLQYLPKFQSIK